MSDSEDVPSARRTRALSMGSGMLDPGQNFNNEERRGSFNKLFSYASSFLEPHEAANNDERRGSFSRLRNMASSFFETSQFKNDVLPKLRKIQEEQEIRRQSTDSNLAEGNLTDSPHINKEALNPTDPKFGQEFPQFVRMLKLARTPSIGGENPTEIQAVIQQNKEQIDEFLTTFCSTGV